jgi:hypothetical protein
METAVRKLKNSPAFDIWTLRPVASAMEANLLGANGQVVTAMCHIGHGQISIHCFGNERRKDIRI